MIHSPSLLRSRKGLTSRPWFIPSSGRVAMPVLIMVLFVAGSTRPSKSALLDTSGDWSVSGQNLSNTRYQAAEGTIGVHTVGNLWLRQLDTHPYAQITQSPVVYNGVVYVGVSSDEEQASTTGGYTCCTFRGSIAALDATTGRPIWQSYTVPPNGGQPGGYSGAAVWSSSPVVDADRNALYITTGDNYSVPSSVSTCIKRAGEHPAMHPTITLTLYWRWT